MNAINIITASVAALGYVVTNAKKAFPGCGSAQQAVELYMNRKFTEIGQFIEYYSVENIAKRAISRIPTI